ncbi:MAG TPA: hypothetical protein VKY92_16715 [Verrucomicrobiae bacterium]|nr:hypothetical protein [Verrucomicrobiae bacterium]
MFGRPGQGHWCQAGASHRGDAWSRPRGCHHSGAQILELPAGLFGGASPNLILIDTGNYYPRQRKAEWRAGCENPAAFRQAA